MARFLFRLPDIGEGIAEAEIVAWHVKVGGRIEEDGQLADMMTDKATVELESPVSGTVVELAGAVGDVVAIGSTLVVIATDDSEQADDASDIAPPPDASVQHALPQHVSENLAEEEEKQAIEATTAPKEAAPIDEQPAELNEAVSASDRKKPAVLASPAVRDRAKSLFVDLSEVKPSADGRIRHADLDAYLRYSGASGFASSAPTRGDTLVKVFGMRRRIADNMAASKRHIPHFTYVEEIEVTKLDDLRADLNANRGDRPKLTMLPLLVTAICRAIPQFPMLNARFDDDAGVVTQFGAVHLGIATQTDAGLMVPVVRDANMKNIWQLSAEIKNLSQLCRGGKATSEQLSGSTLTITSLGPLGGIATTPVINRPEVAIIGPNKIIERPVFEGNNIRKAKLMNLSISCDHRVVDGWDAASFVQAIKRLIETPALLFVD
jgi:2-oxoisovalerate dehydrogenase E2 component (dihydrolipoyl transacylase)